MPFDLSKWNQPRTLAADFCFVKAGFTLLEILVACALVGVLFAIALPATSKISEYGNRTKSISNLRQIGVAARLYANEHNQVLPGQPPATGPDGMTDIAAPQWPALFCAYLNPNDPTVLLDPADASTRRLPIDKILSNTTNNTGFIYNGFDDLAVDNAPPARVPLDRLTSQTDTVLLAQKKPGATPFCLSPIFQPVANLLDLLSPGAYDGGAHYLFVDGSVRYVKWADYSNSFWLVDKGHSLPLPPLPPLPNDGLNHGLYAQAPVGPGFLAVIP